MRINERGGGEGSLRPLAGIRVVEFGSAVSLAFGARLLADLGAEVIKVEPPDGDPLRREGPFIESDADISSSALFGYLNHGKRSVTFDHTTASGAQLLEELARSADLLLSAEPVSTATQSLVDRLVQDGDPDRPAIVAVTPYGKSGSRSGQPGSEFIAQFSGGYAYHQACPVSNPETTPPVGCADREAGMLVGLVVANAAVFSVRAASSGLPKPYIDISAEDVFAYLLIDALADLHGGKLPSGRLRPRGQGVTVAGGLVWLLPCSDGAILVSPREDHQWERWVELMGQPDWASDRELCGSRELRTKNAERLQERMTEWSRGEKAHVVFERAQASRVACFPVSTANDLVANRQLIARGFFQTLIGEEGQGVSIPGLPFEMRSSGGRILPRNADVVSPQLGEANVDLLVPAEVLHPKSAVTT